MKNDICERTFLFGVRVVKLCQYLDKRTGVNRRLAGQLFSSGTSIGANLEEAQAGQSRADFTSKCSIACKEARETLYWLRVAVASEIVTAQRVSALLQECNEIVAILTAIIRNTKRART